MNEVELTVDRIAVGGKAIGNDDNGRITFVEGAVPGERVRVQLGKQSKRFAEGRTIEVLESSPDRTDPPCPYVQLTSEDSQRAGSCGGCDWQHIQPQRQRALRVQMVEDSLRRIGRLDTASFPIESGPELSSTDYRTGVRMIVDHEGRLAYRQRRSHLPLAPDSCVVVHPMIDHLIRTVRLPGASEALIRVSDATGEQLIVVSPVIPEGAKFPAGVVCVGRDSPVLDRTHLHEVVSGVRLRISAEAFFQPSPAGAGLLVEAVRDGLGGIDRGGHLVDAYAGGGLFAATVGSEWTSSGGAVTAIESNPAAVADAIVNAPLAVVMQEEVEKWAAVPAQAVIADPARTGLAQTGVDAITATGAERIVLVSCDAGSLGRDAGLLVAAGYKLSRCTVFDIFNHTSHVEVVTRFDRLP